MTTVCLIGNSHVATLKLALQEVLPDFPGVNTIFFVSDGTSMELDIVAGKLSGRAEHVRRFMALSSATDGDIAPKYDAYVVCGLTLSAMRAIRTYRATMDELRAEGRHRSVTANDLAKGMDSPVRASLALDVVAKLRRLTAAPIFIIATPFVAYERHSDFWQGQIGARVDLLAEAYNLACTRAAEDYDATFVPQPLETVGPNALTTKPEFYRLPVDAVKAEKAHHTHMNAAFGAIVLRDVLKRIVDATSARKRSGS